MIMEKISINDLPRIKNELKGVKGPYVVIANHESAIDFINAAAAIDRRAHFVISNSFYNTMPIKGLIKMAGVIPKQQFQTSFTNQNAHGIYGNFIQLPESLLMLQIVLLHSLPILASLKYGYDFPQAGFVILFLQLY